MSNIIRCIVIRKQYAELSRSSGWFLINPTCSTCPCHGQSYERHRRKLAPACAGLTFSIAPAFTGMEIPTACQSKKPAVYRQRAFSYFRDSVGIRTQDPQLRRLLLYPAELPNHPMYPFGRQMPVRTNRTANIVIFQRIARLF